MIRRRASGFVRWYLSHKVEAVTVLVVAFVLIAVSIATREDVFPPDKAGLAGSQESVLSPATAESQVEPGSSHRDVQGKASRSDDGLAEQQNNKVMYRIDDAGYVDPYIAFGGNGNSLVAGFYNPRDGAPWQGDDLGATGGIPDEFGDPDVATDEQVEEPAEQEIPRDKMIAGRVLSSAGMPLEGIGLIITAEQYFDIPAGAAISPSDVKRQVVTGNGGEFLVRELAAGEYALRSLPIASYSGARASVRAGNVNATIVVEYQRDVLVTGQVASVTGEPLTGALVSPKVLGAKAALTDNLGRYALSVPLKQESGFAVHTVRDGFRETMINVSPAVVAAGDIPLDIVMDPLSKLSVVAGAVTDTSGEPVMGKRVLLFAGAVDQRYQANTDVHGRFAFPNVEVGDGYSVLIHADKHHYEYTQAGLQVPAGGLDVGIELRSRDTGTLTGRMTDLHGQPVPNFSLNLNSQDATDRGLRVTADSAGYFFVPEAPAGQLVLRTNSRPRFWVAGIHMTPGAEVEAPIVLDWGSDRLSGQVIDKSGNPVMAQSIVLTWSHSVNGVNSWSSRETSTDAYGYFQFAQLGRGSHTISVTANGFKPARVHHDLALSGSDVLIQVEQKPL